MRTGIIRASSRMMALFQIMTGLALVLSGGCGGASHHDKVYSTPLFGPETGVVINGYSLDAMEPFISGDDTYLFFNSLNDNVDTSIYIAIRDSDTVFTSRGKLPGVNGTPNHTDAVASMDDSGNFYFVSLRNYASQPKNYQTGIFSGGSVSGVDYLDGDFYQLPGASAITLGSVIMDAEITRDGARLYYVNANYDASGLDYAQLGVASKSEALFKQDADLTDVFAKINDTDYFVYAPSTSADGRELYFTRILKTGGSTAICVAVRSDPSGAFGDPQVIPIEGDMVEAPSISADGKRLYYHRKLTGTSTDGRFHIFMKLRQ
jgi:hypothetical protein